MRVSSVGRPTQGPFVIFDRALSTQHDVMRQTDRQTQHSVQHKVADNNKHFTQHLIHTRIEVRPTNTRPALCRCRRSPRRRRRPHHFTWTPTTSTTPLHLDVDHTTSPGRRPRHFTWTSTSTTPLHLVVGHDKHHEVLV